MHWINRCLVDGVIVLVALGTGFSLSVKSNQTNTLVLVLFYYGLRCLMSSNWFGFGFMTLN